MARQSRQKHQSKLPRRLGKIVASVALGLLLFTVAQVVLFKYVPVYYTPLMLRRSWEAAREGTTLQMHKKWVPLDGISPDMVCAVVALEDNYFRGHYGFSLASIKEAWIHNKSSSRKRGGSTISQQCAKNVFTFGYSTYFRKAVEAYYTVLIELIWGKERIMEVYLNVIEMGDGVFGAEACAQTYFKISAAELTRRQAALVAACLPNPHSMHVDNPSDYVKHRQQLCLSLMKKIGSQGFDDKSLSEARQRYKNRKK